MKQLFIFFIFIITLTISMSSFCTKHLFFEINNVLFNLNENAWGSALISDKKMLMYKNLFFEALDSVDFPLSSSVTLDSEFSIYYQNFKLPHFVSKYYKQELSNQELKRLISESVSCIDTTVNNCKELFWFERSLVKNSFKSTFNNLFNPLKEVEMLVLNGFMADIVKQLSLSSNNKLYIISNKVNDTMKNLINKYPNLFASFKGGFKISGTTKRIKPSKELYLFLLENLALDPSDCYMIDSDPLSINIARQLNMHTFFYSYNNDELLAQLKKWKIIN